MKKLLLFPFLMFVAIANCQLLAWTPDFIKENSNSVTITMDANFGNQALLNYAPITDVYVHIGVITNKSTSSTDWKYVKFTWGANTLPAQCTYITYNQWEYTISGGLRTFFGISDPTETIKKIAILFRNGDGSIVQRNTDGSDMYVPVYDNGLYARIDKPYRQPLYNPIPEPVNKPIGEQLAITAKASVASTLKIYFNGSLLTTASNATSATINTTIAISGNQQIIAEATNGSVSRDTLQFFVTPPNNIADLPPGIVDGINYEPGDTSVTLVLYAPGKDNIFVLGDFNNWAQSANYLMNVTHDGNRFWKRITHLTPGTEYAYQYLINGTLKVADYNTEKILDPNNDQYIPSSTYPNLKLYPAGKTTGIVSILQTAKPTYHWQVTNFTRPDKRNLVIYELLVRDFVAGQNWQTIKDTLSYLKRLGINAIEVMPFNEFEGNISWGYNPSFYFASDKFYGTEIALKQFIDECHKQGIAVIMDIALNHSFGQSPMVQMYWDAANNRPAANSPWFNPVPKHAYNVGYDINHESQATIDFVNRVIHHWLVNYKIDGFRWDLSKGFTQKQTCDNNGNNCNVDAWSAYDSSRVTIWKRYYGFMQTASQGSYCILEHFATNTEEIDLANSGMLLWGNLNYNFNEATMGWLTNSNFEWGIYTERGWTQPNLVTYQESHDEERLMYKNEQYANISNASYDTRSISIGTKRNGMAAAFWSMIPGPKMMWEFGELGYDFSINRCPDGSISDNCRTDPKPIHWDYYQNADRKSLYDVYSKLLKLRATPNYVATFTTGAVADSLSNATKWLSISSDSLKVMVLGNFDVAASTATVTFPSTGIWHSYLTDSTTNIASTSVTVTLQPGEYYVFTNKDVKEIILPVNWLGFTAQKTGKKMVELKWTVANEINDDHYEVQRSANSSSFSTIATVVANNKPQYQYIDSKPFNTINYYRIKQVDKDGKYSYSSIAKISFDDSKILWQVYPNPANNITAIYAQKELTKAQIVLTDLSGKVVYRKIYNNISTGQHVDLLLNNFSKGVYMLKIISEQGSKTEKIAVN